MEHKDNRLAVVLGDEFLELEQCLVERAAVVELHGAMQRDRLLRNGVDRKCQAGDGEAARKNANECVHGFLLGSWSICANAAGA